MARYLVRLANSKRYGPRDAVGLSIRIRDLLGSKDTIGNLRVSRRAVEFDLFANDPVELEARKLILESKVARILTLKSLDQAPANRDKLEVLREGIGLFNEERFWECHEVLEQIWHPAKGADREIIQGLILTAAALVHAQKDETDVCLSMLRKARGKLGSNAAYEGVGLQQVRISIDRILASKHPVPFRVDI